MFTNANMAPHLQPTPGTTYIFDMFAPKILELLSSGRTDRDWEKDAAKKERAMALADHVWVNGRRKIGYALGWLLRPSVERIRTEKMGKHRLITGDPMRHVSLVEMPVPLPDGVEVRAADHGASTPLRVGVAGYVQRWSALDERVSSPTHPTRARPRGTRDDSNALGWIGARDFDRFAIRSPDVDHPPRAARLSQFRSLGAVDGRRRRRVRTER